MLYLNRPLFDFEIDWTRPVQQDWRKTEPPQLAPSWTFTLQLLRSEEVSAVDAFFAGLTGRVQGFWLPTPLKSAELLAAAPDGSWVEVPSDLSDLSDPSDPSDASPSLLLRHLFITRAGAQAAVQVASASPSGAGVTRLTFATPVAPGLLVPDATLRRLAYVRLAEDLEQAAWQAEGWQVRPIRVIELPEAEAAAELEPAPVYLYHFWMDAPVGADWWFTSFPAAVVSQGRRHAAALITHRPGRRGWPLTPAPFEIETTVPAEERAGHPLALFGPPPPSRPLWVEVRRASTADLDTAALWFRGHVCQVRNEGARRTAVCADLFGAFNRAVPALRLQTRCNYAPYDPRTCQARRARFETRAVLLSLSADGGAPTLRVTLLSPTAERQASDYFAPGWLETGAGLACEARTILGSQSVGNPGQLELELNAPLGFAQPGQLVQLIPGCDGALATCRDKFANAGQFGGFPFLPAASLPSAESAILPWLAGRRRITMTPCGSPLGVHAVPSTVGTSAQTVATFAGVLCHGPIGGVDAILADGHPLWLGTVFFGNADYVDLTLPGVDEANPCACRVYAGTESQAPDPHLRESAGQTHPAYRGVAYAVLREFPLTPERATLPKIEFLVRRDLSDTNGPSEVPPACQVNPVAILYEWLTHPRFGLGLDPALLEDEALQTAADTLSAERFLLAPLLSQPASFHTLLRHWCDCVSARPVLTAAGRFSVVLDRPPSTPEALPEITPAALAEPACLEFADWSQAIPETHVRFTNASRDFAEDIAVWRDGAALAVGGLPARQMLDRPWVVTAGVAENAAMAAGRSAALPGFSGRLKPRDVGAWFADLAPGQCFRLTDPAHELRGLICRVTERFVPEPPASVFEVAFAAERSYLIPGPGRAKGSSQSFTPPSAAGIPATPPPPFLQVRVVELPLALCRGGQPTLTVLAGKQAAGSCGAAVWLARNYDGTASPPEEAYERIATAALAQAGALVQDYPAGRTEASAGGPVVQLAGPDLILGKQTVFDALSDAWLLFLGNEILSVSGVQTLGPGKYRLAVWRGRFSTPQDNHAVGTPVFLIRADALPILSHPHFQVGNTARFKIAPATVGQGTPLAEVSPIPLAITGRCYRDLAPFDLTVNGEGTNATYAAAAGLVLSSDAPAVLARLPQEVAVAGSLEVVAEHGNLLQALSVPAVLENYTIPWSQLSGWLGPAEDFRVRLGLVYTAPWFTIHSPTVEMDVHKEPTDR